MLADRDEAERFLADYQVPDEVAQNVLRGLSEGTVFSAIYTYASKAHIKAVRAGNGLFQGYEVHGFAPTTDMLYQHTLDGLYEGDSSGNVEAPTGWFAKVRWPWNGRWYLIGQDDQGFKDQIAAGEKSVERVWAAMEREFGRWDALDRDDDDDSWRDAEAQWTAWEIIDGGE